MKKSDIIVIALGIAILVFLFWFLFIYEDSEEKKKQPQKQETITTTDNTTTQPSPEEKQQMAAEKELENKVKQFTTDFLKKYSQYNPAKPTDQIEQIKPFVTDQVYQEQKNLYSVPMPNMKSRRYLSLSDFQYTQQERKNITVEAVVNIETINDNQTFTQEIYYILDLTPIGDSWKVRGMQYVGHGE